MESDTRYFLLRRLHSLLGIFPLGAFLFAHLLTNAQAMLGARAFEEKVALIHSLGPALPLVEALFIFIPLLLHIALGVAIALQGKGNTGTLKYARNYAYTAQRVSGWVALVFIAYHVITLRFLHDMDSAPFSAVLSEHFRNPLYVIGYLVGSASVIFHFANGICTFCMTWGITIGPKSQSSMAKFATAVGAVLMVLMVSSIIGFARMDPQEAHRIGKEVHGSGGAITLIER